MPAQVVRPPDTKTADRAAATARSAASSRFRDVRSRAPPGGMSARSRAGSLVRKQRVACMNLLLLPMGVLAPRSPSVHCFLGDRDAMGIHGRQQISGPKYLREQMCSVGITKKTRRCQLRNTIWCILKKLPSKCGAERGSRDRGKDAAASLTCRRGKRAATEGNCSNLEKDPQVVDNSGDKFGNLPESTGSIRPVPDPGGAGIAPSHDFPDPPLAEARVR